MKVFNYSSATTYCLLKDIARSTLYWQIANQKLPFNVSYHTHPVKHLIEIIELDSPEYDNKGNIHNRKSNFYGNIF